MRLKWTDLDPIALASLAIALLALLYTAYSNYKSRKEREAEKEEAKKTFSKVHFPILNVKPKFILEPTNNRLVLDITNLHSSTHAMDFQATCRSSINFNNKTEDQSSKLAIDSIGPSTNLVKSFNAFFCDFDSFLSNLGESRFLRGAWEVNRAEAIKELKAMGYLRNGQPPIGELKLSWSYKVAQIETQAIISEATYELYIWEYEHGVFLSLP